MDIFDSLVGLLTSGNEEVMVSERELLDRENVRVGVHAVKWAVVTCTVHNLYAH